MISTVYEYRADQEGPAIPLEWRDGDGALRDFSTGWTFEARIALATDPLTVLVTKTTGITGDDTAPNLVIDWSTSDFSTLTPADAGTIYVVHVYARRTADSKDFGFRPGNPIQFVLYPAPA